MWKAERKNGTYIEERVEICGVSKIVSVKVTTTVREAKTRLQEKVDRLTVGKTRFSVAADAYIHEQEMTCRPNTVERNRITLNTLLKIFGDVDLNDTSAGYYREKLIASGKSTETLNQYLKCLKAFLNWSYQNDYLKNYDSIAKLTSFKAQSARSKVEDKYLESEELNTLIEGMSIQRWALLTEFLALSGCRIGEAIGLDLSDIDDMYIHVTETEDIHHHGKGPVKTEDSIRDIFIQPELRDCLRRIHKCMKEQQEAIGYKPTNYLFTGTDGKRVSYYSYNKYLKENAERLIPERAEKHTVTPHTLRHTMTSLFAAAGVPLDVISRRLGHSDSALTKEIYLHVTEEMRKRDNEIVEHTNILAFPDQANSQAKEQAKVSENA